MDWGINRMVYVGKQTSDFRQKVSELAAGPARAMEETPGAARPARRGGLGFRQDPRLEFRSFGVVPRIRLPARFLRPGKGARGQGSVARCRPNIRLFFEREWPHTSGVGADTPIAHRKASAARA